MKEYDKIATDPLRPEEQRLCVQLWQNNKDYNARDRLVRSMTRLIIKFVNGFANIPVDDAIQNCLIRGTESVDKFDTDSDYAFGTYARHWIIRAIHETYVESHRGNARAAQINANNKRKRRENELYASGHTAVRAAQIAYSEQPEGQRMGAEHPVALDKVSLAVPEHEYNGSDMLLHHVQRFNDRRIIQFNLGLIGQIRWTFESLGRVMKKSRQAVNMDYLRGIRNLRGAACRGLIERGVE